MLGSKGLRRSPTVNTGLLAAGLALTGAGLAAVAPTGALINTPLPVAGIAATIAAAFLFCVAELNLIHTEFRRQAYSFTLAGIPLVLALLLLPGRDAVLARLAGAAAAFAIQRPSMLKGTYNLGAYASKPLSTVCCWMCCLAVTRT